MATITEKKLKEQILSFIPHKQGNPMINLYFKLSGLIDAVDSFTADDLSFIYRINKLMVLGYLLVF